MKLTRKTYSSRPEKVRDFIIGVVLWHLVNAVVIIPLFVLPLLDPALFRSGPTPDWFGVLSSFCPLILLIVNIGGIILFALARAWVALGALASIGFYLFLSLCAGVLFVGWCFISLANPSGSR